MTNGFGGLWRDSINPLWLWPIMEYFTTGGGKGPPLPHKRKELLNTRLDGK
jgi:hypothetical protein